MSFLLRNSTDSSKIAVLSPLPCRLCTRSAEQWQGSCCGTAIANQSK